MSKTHTLCLTNGGMHRLQYLLSTPGNVSKPTDAWVACELQEKHLLSLPEHPALPDDCQHDQTKALAFVRAWERQGEHKIEVTERERDVCKTATRTAIERGTVAPGPGLFAVMRELGMTE